MAKKIKLPKYTAGETYYLSHKSGAPARICVDMVYMKPRSTEWMYAIYSEANGRDAVYIAESVLEQRISKHDSPIYKHPEVIKRIDNGYRFAGNYEMDEAITRGEKFACNHRVKSVILYPALDAEGREVSNWYGVWIKWNCVISGKGVNESEIVLK